MQVVIFSSPQRKKNLSKLKKELKGHDVFIINDPDTFGKENFWKRWEQARQYCIDSKHDNYAFLHDDLQNIDLDIINKIFKKFENKPFVCATKTDERKFCWGSAPNKRNHFSMDDYIFEDIGFFDCCGISNRSTMNKFIVQPVHNFWFDRPNKSSGVGYQLSLRFRRLHIPMFVTYPSIASHGLIDSAMHPEERKVNPLKSIGK